MGGKTFLRNTLKKSYNYFQFAVGSKVFWRSPGERKHIELNWGDVTSQPDFPEKFIKLTRGMDAKSVSTVIRILSRQKTILNSNKRILDLFTEKEQRELRELKENFYDEVFQLSDDLVAYKNYLLPKRPAPTTVYYKEGTSEVENLANVKGKTIVDVGGYIGDSVLFFEDLDPDKIYTFEPSPDNFELMKRTIELNGLKNVVAENLALGAEKGECTLYVHDGNGGSTGIIKRGAVKYRKEIKVPLLTFDDYVAVHKIENIALIKVDIEGAEPMFLAGAKKTICAQKPILLLSIYHNAHDFFELKPLIESWDLGYKFKIYKPTFSDVDEETMLIAEIL